MINIGLVRLSLRHWPKFGIRAAKQQIKKLYIYDVNAYGYTYIYIDMWMELIAVVDFWHKELYLRCCRGPRSTHAKGKKSRTEHIWLVVILNGNIKSK